MSRLLTPEMKAKVDAMLAGSPVSDHESMMRGRVEAEARKIVNWCTLWGVSIPEPEATESEQVLACKDMLLPKRIARPVIDNFDPYGKLRTIRGGKYRGD